MGMYPTKDEIQQHINNILKDMTISVLTLVQNCGVLRSRITTLHDLDDYDEYELILLRDKVLELSWRIDQLRVNYEREIDV